MLVAVASHRSGVGERVGHLERHPGGDQRAQQGAITGFVYACNDQSVASTTGGPELPWTGCAADCPRYGNCIAEAVGGERGWVELTSGPAILDCAECPEARDETLTTRP
jgi:hypothetical protein